MIQITNAQFLEGLFGEDKIWAHITSFLDDPSNIPDDRRFICWGGDYASRVAPIPDSNQYFTISTFNPDETGRARRRKSLFRCTHVIVADDVREKLPIENVQLLPAPSWILETSPGSEQWGWILDYPATDRARVENLLDGLVAQGLAPAGKDPGMKGVTRYVRLPDGVNSKSSRILANGGVPPRCRMLEWNPDRKVSLEVLAAPFAVDLDAERRESRVDGAADLPDHPLIDLEDIIHIKDVRSDGRFDVTCPWVSEHTGAADDGAAIFTNSDGSIGFKCHHGACQGRTGNDLLDLIEEQRPSFRQDLEHFKVKMVFDKFTLPDHIIPQTPIQPEPMDWSSVRFDVPEGVDGYTQPEADPAAMANVGSAAPLTVDAYTPLFNALRMYPPTSAEAIQMATEILKAVDQLPHSSRVNWQESVRDYMCWTKPDFKIILTEEREKWYPTTDDTHTVYDDFTYIIGLGQFYNPKKDMFMKPEVFQNGYCHIDEEIRSKALIYEKVVKADAIDYAPGYPEYFNENGINYCNTYRDTGDVGMPGDVSPWLNHFDALGWSGEDKEHLLNFFAYTLQYPGEKINHAIILGGGEGIGKDTLFWPLTQAMGRNSRTIHSKQLTKEHNDYLLNTKLLHINELDAANYSQAAVIANQIKDFITAPPMYLSINQKYLPLFKVRNVVNVIIGTNESLPVKISGDSRRYFVLWSDLRIRMRGGDVLPEWAEYFKQLWFWMRDQHGWRACVDYLYNRDVSQFDPKASPRVTEALRDVQEASEDPVMSVFFSCVYSKISLFKSDLLTINDIHQVMRSANISEMGVNLKNLPSAAVLGKIIRQANVGKIIRVVKDGVEKKLYTVRDEEKYEHMRPAIALLEYEKQIAIARQAVPLTSVGGQP